MAELGLVQGVHGGAAVYRPQLLALAALGCALGLPLPMPMLVLAENDVTIFFHGHDHLFVKQDLDGIVYQEVPQPSHASYDKTDSAEKYGYTHGEVLGCCGYLRVAVSPAAVKVAYVRSYRPADENAQRQSGQVTYTYTINAP